MGVPLPSVDRLDLGWLASLLIGLRPVQSEFFFVADATHGVEHVICCDTGNAVYSCSIKSWTSSVVVPLRIPPMATLVQARGDPSHSGMATRAGVSAPLGEFGHLSVERFGQVQRSPST